MEKQTQQQVFIPPVGDTKPKAPTFGGPLDLSPQDNPSQTTENSRKVGRARQQRAHQQSSKSPDELAYFENPILQAKVAASNQKSTITDSQPGRVPSSSITQDGSSSYPSQLPIQEPTIPASPDFARQDNHPYDDVRAGTKRVEISADMQVKNSTQVDYNALRSQRKAMAVKGLKSKKKTGVPDHEQQRFGTEMHSPPREKARSKLAPGTEKHPAKAKTRVTKKLAHTQSAKGDLRFLSSSVKYQLEFKARNKNKDESRKKMASPTGIAHTVSNATQKSKQKKASMAQKVSEYPGEVGQTNGVALEEFYHQDPQALQTIGSESQAAQLMMAKRQMSKNPKKFSQTIVEDSHRPGRNRLGEGLATENLPMTLDSVSPGMFTQRTSQDQGLRKMPQSTAHLPQSQSMALLPKGATMGPQLVQDPLNTQQLSGDEDYLLHTAKRALRKIEKSQDPDNRHAQSLQEGGDTLKFNQQRNSVKQIVVKQLALRNNSNSGSIAPQIKTGSHRKNFIQENIRNVRDKRNSKFSTSNNLYSPRSARGGSVNLAYLKGVKSPHEDQVAQQQEDLRFPNQARSNSQASLTLKGGITSPDSQQQLQSQVQQQLQQKTMPGPAGAKKEIYGFTIMNPSFNSNAVKFTVSQQPRKSLKKQQSQSASREGQMPPPQLMASAPNINLTNQNLVSPTSPPPVRSEAFSPEGDAQQTSFNAGTGEIDLSKGPFADPSGFRYKRRSKNERKMLSNQGQSLQNQTQSPPPADRQAGEKIKKETGAESSRSGLSGEHPFLNEAPKAPQVANQHLQLQMDQVASKMANFIQSLQLKIKEQAMLAEALKAENDELRAENKYLQQHQQ